jgi:hypothetical protein
LAVTLLNRQGAKEGIGASPRSTFFSVFSVFSVVKLVFFAERRRVESAIDTHLT